MERDDVFQDDPSGRSPLALDQGTLLNDQFRVGRVLGVGGFGITYLAVDEVLEMVVAVKEYLPNDIAVRKSDSHTVQPLTSVGEKQDFEFGLKRFLQEARTLAKFEEHDNIVRVRTFFRENGTGYLVMNFYEGRTLAEYLEARNGFLPEEEALLIMEQVFDGLSAVHEADILHRDVDPNNVYLADNGTVVLLDFGAARSAVGERTQSMSVVLKRGYAPHEQYHSHGDQGTWTDVYACAATLYRILTGYKPPESAARILDDDLAPPRELVPSLSDATNDAVLRGLAVRPDDRPRTIDDFAALLPSPAPDAEPGWIGEVTTMETGTATGADAELRLETTHACRLYVDGSQAAELAPGEAYTLGTEPGSHRLRAVRTDQQEGGTATVTAAGDDVPDEGARMTLDSLVWQDVVSTPSDETTTVEIDFEADAADGEDEMGTTPEATVAGEAATQVATATPTEAPESAPAGPVNNGASAGEGTEAPTTAAPAADPASEADGPEDEGGTAPGPAPDPASGASAFGDWIDARTAGVGAAALVLLGIGWWALSGGGVQTGADRVVTMAADTVDVLANDRASSGALRVTRAGPVPDSVAQVAVVDSTRLRLQPAAGFAGTAQVPYEATGAAGATARGTVTLRVPFSGERHVVTQAMEQPQVVRTDSLGENGTLDVLTAALGRRAVAWSENTPTEPGGFRAPKVIEESVDGVVDLATADLTGNGRVDVLSASLRDDVVAWYRNEGDGTFSAPQPLDVAADGASAVRAADFDQDGDMDVVAGAVLDQTVTWYENQGDGTFSDGTPIATNVQGLETLHISDLDRDTVPDVLVVAYKDSTINRYEPKAPSADSLQFVERPAVGADLQDPIDVHTADLFGNGRNDLLAGTVGSHSLVLFKNRGQEPDDASPFGEPRLLAHESTKTVEDIGTGDLDGDGDEDIVAAAFASGAVVWVENQGNGLFAAPQPVATNVPNVISLDVADVDRDGDLDVITASQADNTIGWYENRLADERLK